MGKFSFKLIPKSDFVVREMELLTDFPDVPMEWMIWDKSERSRWTKMSKEEQNLWYQRAYPEFHDEDGNRLKGNVPGAEDGS